MAIDAILLDADGVVQTMSPDFHPSLAALVGEGDPAEALLDEIFEIERAALTGHADFREDLQELLHRRGVTNPVDEVLRVLARIEPVPGMLDLVAGLRARQYPCFVASNQQRYRARHMSTLLGYAAAFTGEFYSCALGVAKPEAGFFRAILRELDLEPGALLFVDDHGPNVEAARALGIRGLRFNARQHERPASALQALIEAELAGE